MELQEALSEFFRLLPEELDTRFNSHQRRVMVLKCRVEDDLTRSLVDDIVRTALSGIMAKSETDAVAFNEAMMAPYEGVHERLGELLRQPPSGIR